MAEKWNRIPYDLTKIESEEERSERIKRATKRVVVRLIDGVFDVEFDVREGEYQISPREFKQLIHSLTLRHRQSMRAGSLSQRMLRKAEEPVSVTGPVGEDPNPIVAKSGKIVVQQNDVLKTFLDR